MIKNVHFIDCFVIIFKIVFYIKTIMIQILNFIQRVRYQKPIKFFYFFSFNNFSVSKEKENFQYWQ